MSPHIRERGAAHAMTVGGYAHLRPLNETEDISMIVPLLNNEEGAE